MELGSLEVDEVGLLLLLLFGVDSIYLLFLLIDYTDDFFNDYALLILSRLIPTLLPLLSLLNPTFCDVLNCY